MYTNHFLAKYGSTETREKLSAKNGPHEAHLYSMQEPTKKMLDNSLASPNYNAQFAAIGTGKLDHEQVDKALSINPIHTLEHYRMHPDKLKELSEKSSFNGYGHDELVENALHQSRPQSEKVRAIRSLLNSKNKNIISSVATSAHEIPKEVHSEIVDKIISSNNSVAARQYSRINSKDHANNTEKLLNHFHPDENSGLHIHAAKWKALTDERVQKNLKDPDLSELMQKNLELTDKQSRMVPGHIFSELDMLKKV